MPRTPLSMFAPGQEIESGLLQFRVGGYVLDFDEFFDAGVETNLSELFAQREGQCETEVQARLTVSP